MISPRRLSAIVVLIALSLFLGLPGRFAAPVHASDPTTALAVGQCLTYSVTQNTPSPTAVTINVCRPDASHLTVTADAASVNSGACTLSLGGTFNVQEVLTPNPIPGSSYIVMQTTDASGGGPASGGIWAVPNYDAVYPSPLPDTYGPLSTIGISATYTDQNCDESTTHYGTAGKPVGYGFVSYSIPFGSAPSGSTGPYNKVKFLCTQPFGYDFLNPCSVTVVPGAPCPENDGNGNFDDGHGHHGNFNHDKDQCETNDEGDQNGDHDNQVSSSDTGDGKDFQSTQIQSTTFNDAGNTVTITGLGTHGGVPVAFTFVALETGPTTPGWVSFAFSDGYSIAGSLTSGNILLH